MPIFSVRSLLRFNIIISVLKSWIFWILIWALAPWRAVPYRMSLIAGLVILRAIFDVAKAR